MKKRLLLVVLVLICALALSACGCKHENWKDADCENPKTCADCGETEGEALGHDWEDADCLSPKTCKDCGETEGDALGHDWVEATCLEAKTCARCAEVEGEALGHTWLEATTEAPETCEACGETQGEQIITDLRFTTEANKDLFGKWEGRVTLPAETLDPEMAPYMNDIPCIFTIEFLNDGTMKMGVTYEDPEGLKNDLANAIASMLYEELAAAGLSKEEADLAMKDAYGMTVLEYANAALGTMDINAMMSAFSVEYKYYVDGAQIYLGATWDMMESDDFTLDGDTLIIPIDMEGFETLTFTRIVE